MTRGGWLSSIFVAAFISACGTGAPAPGAGGPSSAVGGGGGGAPETCGSSEHLCGGECVGNTPETGCFGSTSCEPCPEVEDAVAVCAPDGSCDFQCQDPLEKMGDGCSCPTECCGSADCDGAYKCEGGTCVCPTECCSTEECTEGQKCEGGTCTASCDLVSCQLECFTKGFAVGWCIDNVCVCDS